MIKLNTTILSICFTIFFSQAWGQQATLISDLNPGSNSGGSSEENSSIVYNGVVYFSGNDGEHGYELMKYDGTSITLVKDINEGLGDSESQNFYMVDGKLLFSADDGVHGLEFWFTDGTEEGTQLLIDLNEGAGDGLYAGFGNTHNSFGIYNGELYFNGRDRPNDNELWKTDGTVEGTVLLKNIGYDNASGSFVTGTWPEEFTVFQGNLYFASRDGLWKTNGTTSGTVLILEEDPDDAFGFDPGDLAATESHMFMMHNSDVWVSDGTTSGTKKIKDFENTVLNWFGPRFRVLDDFVLFPANDGVTGDELWRSDGTGAGTQLVIDLYPGEDGYAPQNTVVLDGKMYFKGETPETGIEFYVTDGTAAGTQLVKDINPGSGAGFYLPSTIFTDGKNIFMSAGKPFNQELWVSDGTTEGTFEIDTNTNGESYPSKFLAYNDKIFFIARNGNIGREHFIYDVVSNTNELASLTLSIFPNPSNDNIFLDGQLPENYRVSIYDNLGKLLMNSEDVSNGINIESLNSSIYILSILDKSSNSIYSYRFVKE